MKDVAGSDATDIWGGSGLGKAEQFWWLGGGKGGGETWRARGAGRTQLHISAKLLVSAPNGHFITWSWEKSHAGKLSRISQPLSPQHAWHRATARVGVLSSFCLPLAAHFGVDPLPPCGKNGLQSIFKKT